MEGAIIYTYDKCQTCKNALKFLAKSNISFENRSITENPPTKAELKSMLQQLDGDIKKLFNTSGQVYRQLKLAEKLPVISEDEALALLAENGKLIKRPFLWTGKNKGTVGFKEEVWVDLFA